MSAQIITCKVLFPGESATETMDVSDVGNGQYRLESFPLFVPEANYRDVVEVERSADGVLRFKRVVEKSDWRSHIVCVSQEVVNSPGLKLLLERVLSQGGYWERNFGGIVAISLPPDSQMDPAAEFEKVSAPSGQ